MKLKNQVIFWKTHGQARKGTLLARAIKKYEASQITKSALISYYEQLWRM